MRAVGELISKMDGVWLFGGFSTGVLLSVFLRVRLRDYKIQFTGRPIWLIYARDGYHRALGLGF